MSEFTTGSIFLLAGIIFFGAFQNSMSGFGFGLVTMPLLTVVIGLESAAPLVALAGLTLNSVQIMRYYRVINFREVSRLAIAAAVGVPVGVWAVVSLRASDVKLVLGLFLLAYATYCLASPATRQLRAGGWAYLAGFMAGCLHGSYNIPGPPMVVYGSLRGWYKEEFRAILQGLFFVTGCLTVASQYLANRVTPTVLSFYAYAALPLLAGIFLGFRLDGHINKERFRLLILFMIMAVGLSLALGSRG